MAPSDPEGDVDCVGDLQSVHRLKHEREVEPLFQLDYDRGFLASHRYDVACSDLSLHHIALSLQKPLDRAVKLNLRHSPPRRQASSREPPCGTAHATEKSLPSRGERRPGCRGSTNRGSLLTSVSGLLLRGVQARGDGEGSTAVVSPAHEMGTFCPGHDGESRAVERLGNARGSARGGGIQAHSDGTVRLQAQSRTQGAERKRRMRQRLGDPARSAALPRARSAAW